MYSFNGTSESPITNATIRGLTLRDTAYTFMDAHGMPSGGDWLVYRKKLIVFGFCVCLCFVSCMNCGVTNCANSQLCFVMDVSNIPYKVRYLLFVFVGCVECMDGNCKKMCYFYNFNTKTLT